MQPALYSFGCLEDALDISVNSGNPFPRCVFAVLRVDLQTGWRQPVTLPGGRRPR